MITDGDEDGVPSSRQRALQGAPEGAPHSAPQGAGSGPPSGAFPEALSDTACTTPQTRAMHGAPSAPRTICRTPARAVDAARAVGASGARRLARPAARGGRCAAVLAVSRCAGCCRRPWSSPSSRAAPRAFVADDKAVQLSVDGKPRTLHTFADDVAELLADEGVSVGAHDMVAPAPRHPPGQRRRGRRTARPAPCGSPSTASAARCGRPRTRSTGRCAHSGCAPEGAYLSVSRSRRIDRTGLTLDVRTERTVTVLADGRTRTIRTNAATVSEAVAPGRASPCTAWTPLPSAAGELPARRADESPCCGSPASAEDPRGADPVPRPAHQGPRICRAAPRSSPGRGGPGPAHRLRHPHRQRRRAAAAAADRGRSSAGPGAELREGRHASRVPDRPSPGRGRASTGARSPAASPAAARTRSTRRGPTAGCTSSTCRTWRSLGGSGAPRTPPAPSRPPARKQLYVTPRGRAVAGAAGPRLTPADRRGGRTGPEHGPVGLARDAQPQPRRPPRPRRRPRAGRRPRRPPHQAARPELRHRRQHRPPDRPHRRGAARRRGRGGRPRPRLADPGAAGGRRPGHRRRDRRRAGRRAARHRRRPAAASAPTASRWCTRDAMRVTGAARARRPPRWSPTSRTTSPCPCCCTCSSTFPSIERTLVMVQAEVADRLAARPGSKVYGVPSVKANWYARRQAGRRHRPQRLLARAQRRLAAWSRWSGAPSRSRRPPRRAEVFAVVDAAFAQRRKTLRAALAGLGGLRGRRRGGAGRRRGLPAGPRRVAHGRGVRRASPSTATARDRAARRDRTPTAPRSHAVTRHRPRPRQGQRPARGGRRRAPTASTTWPTSSSPSACTTRSPRPPPTGCASPAQGPDAAPGAAGRAPTSPPAPPIALAARHGIAPDVHLHIAKDIPVAGGMAGGSADARRRAARLRRAVGHRRRRARNCSSICAELGSDVPFSLVGGAALGTGRGRAADAARGRRAPSTGCSRSPTAGCPPRRSTASSTGCARGRATSPRARPPSPGAARRAARRATPTRSPPPLANDLQAAALSLRPRSPTPSPPARAAGALAAPGLRLRPDLRVPRRGRRVRAGRSPTPCAASGTCRHARRVRRRPRPPRRRRVGRDPAAGLAPSPPRRRRRR